MREGLQPIDLVFLLFSCTCFESLACVHANLPPPPCQSLYLVLIHLPRLLSLSPPLSLLLLLALAFPSPPPLFHTHAACRPLVSSSQVIVYGHRAEAVSRRLHAAGALATRRRSRTRRPLVHDAADALATEAEAARAVKPHGARHAACVLLWG
eukprot:6209819-Pleurochrysis_carterae.AAC.6